MTQLTTDTPRSIDQRADDYRQRESYGLAAQKAYVGSAMGWDRTNSIARQLVAGDAFLGFLRKTVDNSTGSAGDKKIELVSVGIVRGLAVTNATSTTEPGTPVYASDGATFTTAAGANSRIGRVVRGTGSGTADVYFEADWKGNVARRIETHVLGEIDFATLANANLKTGYTFPFKGRILKLYTITNTVLVGSGGTGLINAEIGGTNVTGGVVTLATATQATLGTRSDGTAITAENEFDADEAIDIEASSVSGTTTSGKATLYAEVERY